MWQMREHEFCLVCHSNRQAEGGKPVNNNYVANSSTKTMR